METKVTFILSRGTFTTELQSLSACTEKNKKTCVLELAQSMGDPTAA